MKKNYFKKLIRDKMWLSVGLLCLVLVTSIAVTAYFTRSSKDDIKELDPVVKGTEESSKTDESLSSGTVAENPGKNDNDQHSANIGTKEDPKNQVVNNDPTQEETQDPMEVVSNNVQDLDFTADTVIGWPVSGNVIQMFSMDTTVWFPTLEQYKVSRGMEIQCETGTLVACVANSVVLEVGRNEELGNYIVMDMGNGYQAVYGQLEDIRVGKGEYVTAGRIFASVSEPTRYYVIDGPHLYFEMRLNETPIDPLDYIQ